MFFHVRVRTLDWPAPYMEWTSSHTFSIGKCCCRYFVSRLHLLSFGVWYTDVHRWLHLAHFQVICQPLEMCLAKRPHPKGSCLGMEFSLCRVLWKIVCHRPSHLLSLMCCCLFSRAARLMPSIEAWISSPYQRGTPL